MIFAEFATFRRIPGIRLPPMRDAESFLAQVQSGAGRPGMNAPLLARG